MFDLSEEYGFDEQRAAQGVWMDLGKGARLRIAMIGTPTYRKTVFLKAQQVSARSRNVQVSFDQNDSLTLAVLSESIVLGWEGIYDEGKELPYSPANVVKFLTKYPRFRDDIEAFASNASNFQRVSDMEADAKNS